MREGYSQAQWHCNGTSYLRIFKELRTIARGSPALCCLLCLAGAEQKCAIARVAQFSGVDVQAIYVSGNTKH